MSYDSVAAVRARKLAAFAVFLQLAPLDRKVL